MNYAQNLTEFRKEKSISQNQLAELLQTTQQQISKYEKGVQEIPVRHLITIADTYNTSIDYLTGRKREHEVSISAEELNVLKGYGNLTEKNKGKLELFLEQLLESQAEMKDAI